MTSSRQRPWLRFYGAVPPSIDYPRVTLYEAVAEACVIGVPDEVQVERVKAVVVLEDPAQEGAATTEALTAFCRERLIKWSCPREIEYRRELPRTRVGKIDFKVLVAEHNTRAGQAKP